MQNKHDGIPAMSTETENKKDVEFSQQPDYDNTLYEVGKALERARKRVGLSVEEVSRKIKYTSRQILALEAGERDSLPPLTFTRGMIQNYARLLELDVTHYLAQIGTAAAPSVPEHKIAMRNENIIITKSHYTTPLLRKLLIGLAVITIPLAGYELLRDKGHLVSPQEILTNAEVSLKTAREQSPELVNKLESSPTNKVASAEKVDASMLDTLRQQLNPRKENTGSEAVEVPLPLDQVSGQDRITAAVTQSTQVTVPPQTQSSATDTSNNTQTAQNVPPAKEGEATIKLAFEGESWVQVRDQSGKTIYSKLNKAGSEEVIQGKAPFSIIVGNAPEVQLTYNDKPIDLTAYAKVRVARLKLQ